MKRKLSRLFAGHVNIGNATIYGNNAMHWSVNYWTKRWGCICFTLPIFNRWGRMYIYCSPNATPWASTFYRGNLRYKAKSKERRLLADKRRAKFGHNFNTDTHWAELQEINKDSRW